jgi:5-methylcytosine-specific restriction endonuclease McrA
MPGDPFYRSPFWRRLRAEALRRDGYRCVVPGCLTPTQELTVDHIRARPRGVPGPTRFDVLSNLRTLCGSHDRRIKERPDGRRASGGRLKGCGADGWPVDSGPTPRG